MFLQVGRVFHRRRGDADDLAADRHQLERLLRRDAAVSIVSQVIIDCTRIGFAPPTPTLPTITSREIATPVR